MNPTHPSLIQTLRQLPPAAWILFAGTFLNKFGAFVVPFLALYLGNRGYTTAQAALALAAYGLGHIFAAALGGYLADRIGRRKTIAISMFSSAAAMLCLSQAQDFAWIVILTAFTGLGAELYRPASSALLADLVPETQRVAAFAAYRWCFNAGWAFGPATAGFLSKHSFTWLFVGDALTSIAFGVLAWIALPHGVRSKRGEAGWGEALKVMKHDRHLHVMLASSFAVALVFLQMASTFGLQVTARGFSPATYGALISMNGVLVVLFELPLINWTRRLPPLPTIAFGQMLIGLGFAAAAFARTVPQFAAVVLVFTLGEMIAMPVWSGYIANTMPAQMRGRYTGAYGLVWALGLLCGPPIGMVMFSRVPTLLWLVCGALGVLGGLIVLTAKRTARANPDCTTDQSSVQPGATSASSSVARSR